MMIMSSCLITTITSFLRLLSIKMLSFMLHSFPMYLKPVFSTSLIVYHVHLVSWTHEIFIYLLIVISTNSLSLPVKGHTFQLPKWIIFSLTRFLVPRTRRVKWEDSCLFDTTFGRWCSTSLKWWRSGPRSFIIISGSRYDTPTKRRWSNLYSLIIISGFQYDASLRGWCLNKIWLNFIFIKINCFSAWLATPITTLFLYLNLKHSMEKLVHGVARQPDYG
jgi:hypothetical protein